MVVAKEQAVREQLAQALREDAGVTSAGVCSPHGDRVVVKADAIDDRVEIRVVDRGPGVPDDAKERIFEPFQRYGDAPRGAGVGLGLAVARGFAEAMDGTLMAEDTPGGGLTMVLSLPVAIGSVEVEAAGRQEENTSQVFRS